MADVASISRAYCLQAIMSSLTNDSPNLPPSLRARSSHEYLPSRVTQENDAKVTVNQSEAIDTLPEFLPLVRVTETELVRRVTFESVIFEV